MHIIAQHNTAQHSTAHAMEDDYEEFEYAEANEFEYDADDDEGIENTIDEDRYTPCYTYEPPEESELEKIREYYINAFNHEDDNALLETNVEDNDDTIRLSPRRLKCQSYAYNKPRQK